MSLIIRKLSKLSILCCREHCHEDVLIQLLVCAECRKERKMKQINIVKTDL